jgi:hypothetical protein
MIHRRELFRLLAGAPVAAFAAIALTGKEVFPKAWSRPIQRICPHAPFHDPTPVEIRLRLQWIAKQSAEALAVTAGPTLENIRTVTTVFIGVLPGEFVRLYDYRDTYRGIVLKRRAPGVEMKHHIRATLNFNGGRLFDDEYMRLQIKARVDILAEEMALAAARPVWKSNGDHFYYWAAPELIAFASLPMPITGTGAFGAWAAHRSVLTRAVLSYCPRTLGQTLSIDSLFGLA